MSKLVFCLFSVILFSSAVVVKDIAPEKRRPASQEPTQAEDYSKIWGKASGPVQVRIVEKEVANGYVTLEGEIQTQLPSVNVEWTLPRGVTMIQGTSQEVVTRQANGGIVRSRITVKISGELEKPHIVFLAYIEKNGERIGHSRVYSLTKSDEDKAKEMKIQQMFKTRGAKLVR